MTQGEIRVVFDRLPFGRSPRRDAAAILSAAVTILIGLPAPAQQETSLPDELADAPAVVLRHTRTWEIWERKSRISVEKRIKILDRLGFDEADQEIQYLAETSRLAEFTARTVRTDGTSIPIPPDLQRDSVVFKSEEMELRSTRFTFPAVEVGSVLEWSYTIERGRASWWEWWEIQEPIPVIEASFAITFHGIWALTINQEPFGRASAADFCDARPTERTRKYTTHTYVCANVPAFKQEPFAPPENDARLRLMMTWWPVSEKLHVAFWSVVHESWAAAINRFSSGRRRARSLARELVVGVETESERLDRIFGFVKDEVNVTHAGTLDNVGRGQGGAMSVDDVLEYGGGSSAEVTLLTKVLLEEARIKTEAVLVGDRSESQFRYKLPDPHQRLHLMLRVLIDDKPGYLDPACSYCRAGVPDWRYCDDSENGLRVTSAGAYPVTIGTMPAEQNVRQYDDRVLLSADGSAIVEGFVQFHGQEDPQLRRYWAYLTEVGRADVILADIAGDIDETSVATSDPEDYRAVLRADYSYHRQDMALKVGDSLLLSPPDVMTPSLAIPNQEERERPLWWPFRRSVRARVEFELPEDYRSLDLPKKTTIEGPGVKFDSLWSAGKSDNEISWNGLYVRTVLSASARDYPELREFASRVRVALRGGVLLVPANAEDPAP